jgi:adenylosuccinate synthase
VLETLPGWEDDLGSCSSVEELPEAARAYVDFVERELDVAVTLVGTGAERESVLSR